MALDPTLADGKVPVKIDDLVACMREVVDPEALDGIAPGSTVADFLDSFARVRLVPVLEDRLGVRLEQSDLAHEHWTTVATLAARLGYVRAGRR